MVGELGTFIGRTTAELVLLFIGYCFGKGIYDLIKNRRGKKNENKVKSS